MRVIAILLLSMSLAACSFPGVFKINVQQGSIVTERDLAKLEPGMSRSQVHSALGSPLVINPVNDSRDYYIYTFQRGGGEIREQRIIVFYDGDTYTHHDAVMLDEVRAY
ncbi:MAG: outer membrane protein assembly factor BamE [Marinobacter sp.]|nr:outer membrane protein assembly factor BamE [Marinobacter sp.]